ncbi:inositol monophosphatase family protein [Haoranjiania flava]|uniref:Inositol-1-monophosphatase n=1 Tax=Haoranjiania flava TaxID=1856322 RepID=A0AAE3IM14_9BACT|nr:inositol monophosphatase family protein [Haoranjiania flava]MCU7693470.1 inositol monophosphatase [Haoranjiania flava]
MLKQTLLEAVKKGAEQLHYFFDKEFKIYNKDGVNNPVTEADQAAEKAIINTIKNQFPDHFILSEETGAIPSHSDYKWIIDPIDGTVNFSQGIPICAVSVGLEYHGEIILGAVYNPLANEFFFAEKDKGAFLNDRRISVSKKAEIEKSCFVTGFPYQYLDQQNGPLQVFERLIRRGFAVRRLGSAALDLCWTAAGRFEAFYEHLLQPWDTAAGILILTEAGGKCTNLQGGTFDIYQHGLIASNGLVHDELVKIINP